MSTNNSPTFPLPSGPTQYAAGTPEQHPIGPAQSHAYPPPPPPETRGSRSNSSFMSPSNVPPPHPPAHIRPNYQPIQGPVRNQTLQMPQPQETGVTASTYGQPPPMEHRRGTMQMPDHRDTIHPAPGPYSNYTSQAQVMSHSHSSGSGMMLGVYNPPRDQSDQRHQRSSSHDRFQDDRVPPSIQCTNSGMSSKAPPSHAAIGVTDGATPNKCCGLC